jgi:hypothetical protein
VSGVTRSVQTSADPARSTTSSAAPSRGSLHARRSAGLGSTTAVAPPIVNQVLRSGGQPLDTTSRTFFEPRFGHDFSKVRVYHDQEAGASARAVNALAYTVGSNIVFDSGRYAPDNPVGRPLIAHELTHVVQQQAVRTDLSRTIPIGSPSTVQEHEAAHLASRVSGHGLAGGLDGAVSSQPFALPVLARFPAAAAHLQRAVAGDAPVSTHGFPPGGSGLLGPFDAGGVAVTSRPKAAPKPAPAPAASPVPKAPESKAKPAPPPPAATAPPTKEKAPAAPAVPAAAAPAVTPAAEKGAAGAQSGAPAAEAPVTTAPTPAAAAPPAAVKAPAAGAAEAPPGKGDEAKAAEPGADAGPGEAAEAPKAEASPKNDPAFQAMAGRVKQASGKLKAHAPASAKANEAQAAAVSPPAELKGRASAVQAAAVDREQPKPFDRAGFIKALMEKIASITPKTLGEADDFKESGKVASLKGDLTKQADATKAQAQGDIPAKVQQAPDPSSIPPKEVTPLPAVDAGPPPADVSAAAAMPGPRPDSETSLAVGSASLDHQMAAANVTETQLKKGNEPAFQGAVDAKKTAQADAVTAPQAFRQGEKTTLGQAQAEAKSTAVNELTTMHGGRGAALGKVAGNQTDTKTKDEQSRAQIAQQIEDRYQTTKSRTEARLKQLDTDTGAAFDQGATQAQKAFDNEVDDRMTRYKNDRYDRIGGSVLWAKDKLFGMPDEVDEFYVTARQNYIKRMTDLLNSIASIVETGLNEAKAIVAEGRKSIDDYLNGLPVALKALGQEAAQGIESKFGELEQSIDEKQGDLIDSLAQKYTEKLQQIDDKIAEMKKANGGLVDAAISAVKGVIDTIISLKNMLLNVLAKAQAAIGMIIDDPIGFLGNLVEAVKKGFMGFVGKIGMYIEQGLLGWLFGALAGAGIEMPKSFDLKGILGLVLQVLGLTYANIRSRAVKILGPKVVSALETAAEIFKTLITEGPAGLWRWIKEKFNELKDAVLSSIKDWVITKVITAGVTWILSLLNPASAFIKACKAIYDVVMFFIERGAQIMALVNAILDSIISIAKGNIEGAAAYVESVLAKAVPVVISFLASLLGLGGISEKIKAIIEKIREPINAVIDWVIHKAVDMVKAVGKLLGFGKKEDKPDERTPEQKQADLDRAIVEAERVETGTEATAAGVQEKLPAIKSTYRLTSLVLVHEEDGEYHVEGDVNPSRKGKSVRLDAGKKTSKKIEAAGKLAEQAEKDADNGRRAVEIGEAGEIARKAVRSQEPGTIVLPTKRGVQGPGIDVAALVEGAGDDDLGSLEVEDVKMGRTPRVLKTRSRSTGGGRERKDPEDKEPIKVRAGAGKAAKLVSGDPDVAEKVVSGDYVLKRGGRLVENKISSITENLTKNLNLMFDLIDEAVEEGELTEEDKKRALAIREGKGGTLKLLMVIEEHATVSESQQEAARALANAAFKDLMKGIKNMKTQLIFEIVGGKKKSE